MEFTPESFDQLVKRNSELELQLKADKEFSRIQWLNKSQLNSLTGSWSWDIENNKVEWSDMMYILLGLEPNQTAPSYELALFYVHIEDREVYESSLAKAMSQKIEYYFENRIIKQDKSVINVISRGRCICNEKNELVRMSGTVQDITQLKQLIETNRQLEQFANILSHDFNTPIRTIISFIGLIRERSFENLTEDGKKYFSYVETGARRLSALVEDILEYSKLSAPRLKATDVSIAELIKSVLLDLNVVIIEKKCTISTGWLPDVVKIDRLKIRRVFQNLISNAIKYTSPEIAPIVDIYCEEDGSKFTFFVKDNGIGIDPENAESIYEPYHRINNEKSFDGSGIGLSICRRIVKMHNGEIGHFANKNQGSCFYFSIPK